MAKSATSFEDFRLTRQFINATDDLGFKIPTPVQSKTIPVIMAGQDLIGIAQTGTGKTAAFGLPLLARLKYAQGSDPRGLILAPTKELAIQLDEHIRELAKYTDLRCLCIYGGIGPKTQMEKLDEGVDLIVSTPGRFIELYSKGALRTQKIEVMILDEADKLMDMGFMPQIRKILEVVPHKKRQNLLFSATFPEVVEKLAAEFLEHPTRIEVTPQSTPTEAVAQFVYNTPNKQTKLNLLVHLLKDEERFSRVMVFANTKASADDVGRMLERRAEGGVRVIHGNKGQNSRINAVQDFGEGTVRFLVATDVSARGIDIKEVSHVINFDLPTSRYEDYIHRIGRTGRAYEVGEAISMVNKVEDMHLRFIEEMMNHAPQKLEIPDGVEIAGTPKLEMIAIERGIDYLKRKEDPTFKGAFHEKKKPIKTNSKPTKGNSKKGRSNRSRR